MIVLGGEQYETVRVLRAGIRHETLLVRPPRSSVNYVCKRSRAVLSNSSVYDVVIPPLEHPSLEQILRTGVLSDGTWGLIRTFEQDVVPLTEWSSPNPQDWFLVLGHACAGLSALHAHARWHGNLVPSNVLIRSSDNGPLVRLVDAGWSLHEPAGGVRFCTPTYRRFDFTDDIRSLARVVIERIRALRLESAHEASTQVPLRDDALEQVLQRLLHASIDGDVRSATDAASLCFSNASFDGSETLAPPTQIWTTATIVGREQAFAAFDKRVEDLAAGRGGGIVFRAEEGAGLTTLLDACARRVAMSRGVQVLWAAGPCPGPLSPFDPFVSWLRTRVGRKSLRVAELGDRLDSIALDPTEDRYARLHALATFLAACGAHAPIILVLDETRVDAIGLEILLFLGAALAHSQVLLVVGTHDPSLIRDTESLQTIDLSSIDMSLLRPSLQTSKPDESEWSVPLARAFESAAVPAIVQHLHHVSLLKLEDQLSSWTDLDAACAWRMEHVSGLCRRLLQAAALLGRTFRSSELFALFEEPSKELFSALIEAFRQEIIWPSRQVGEWLFVSASLHRAATRSLPMRTRTSQHARIATMLDSRGVRPGEEVMHRARVAEHLLRVGDASRSNHPSLAAVSALSVSGYRREAYALATLAADSLGPENFTISERLADLEVSLGLVDAAMARYESILAAETLELLVRSVRVQVTLKLVQLLRGRGLFRNAMLHLEDVLPLCEHDLSLRAEVLTHAAECACAAGDTERATHWVRPLLEIASKLGLESTLARGALVQAQIASLRGSWSDALERLGTARRAADRVRDERLRTDVEVALTLTCANAGEIAAAMEHGERAVGMLQRLGQLRALGRLHNTLGTLHSFVGQWSLARENWEAARAVCARANDPFGEREALIQLSVLLREVGEYDRASSMACRVLEKLSERADARCEALARGNLAEIAMRRGDLLSAEPLLRRALEVAGSIKDASVESELLRAMTRLRLLQEDTEIATELARRASECADASGNPNEIGMAMRERASVLLEQEQADEAIVLLDASDEVLGRCGNRVEQARVRLLRAQLALAQGNKPNALAMVRDAVQTFQRHGRRPDLVRAQQFLKLISDEQEPTVVGVSRVRTMMTALTDFLTAGDAVSLPAIAIDRVVEIAGLERGAWIDVRLPGQQVVLAARGSRDPTPAARQLVRRLLDQARSSHAVHWHLDAQPNDAIGQVAVAVPIVVRGVTVAVIVAEGERRAQLTVERYLVDTLSLQLGHAYELLLARDQWRQRAELLPMLCNELSAPTSMLQTQLTSMLESEPTLSQHMRAKVGAMLTHNDRTGQILRTLARYQRVTEREPQQRLARIDVREVVEDTVRFLEPLAQERNTELALDIREEPGWIQGDHDAFVQVLTGMIDVATRATRGVGKTSVTVQPIELALETQFDGSEWVESTVQKQLEIVVEPSINVEPANDSVHAEQPMLGLSLLRELVSTFEGTLMMRQTPRGLPALTLRVAMRDGSPTAF